MQLNPSSSFLGLYDVLLTTCSAEQAIDLLGQIRDLGEPAGLPFMFGWIHHEKAAVREAADQAVAAMLAAIPASDSRSRRFIFQLLSDSGALGADSVQQALVQSHDPFTGVLCLGALEKSSAPVSRVVLLAAVNAKSAMLRAKALQLWQARGLEGLAPACCGRARSLKHVLDTEAVLPFAMKVAEVSA